MYGCFPNVSSPWFSSPAIFTTIGRTQPPPLYQGEIAVKHSNSLLKVSQVVVVLLHTIVPYTIGLLNILNLSNNKIWQYHHDIFPLHIQDEPWWIFRRRKISHRHRSMIATGLQGFENIRNSHGRRAKRSRALLVSSSSSSSYSKGSIAEYAYSTVRRVPDMPWDVFRVRWVSKLDDGADYKYPD